MGDLTDVTLANEDINSILDDNANRPIQGNEAIQVVPHGGQIFNLCKWHQLVVKFGTNVFLYYVTLFLTLALTRYTAWYLSNLGFLMHLSTSCTKNNHTHMVLFSRDLVILHQI